MLYCNESCNNRGFTRCTREIELHPPWHCHSQWVEINYEEKNIVFSTLCIFCYSPSISSHGTHEFAIKKWWKRRNKKWENFFKNEFNQLCHPKAILKVKQKDLCSVPLSLLNLKVRRIRNDFFKPTFLPKNERTNLTLLLVDLFSVVFWKKVKTPKRHFEINWPLSCQNLGSIT